MENTTSNPYRMEFLQVPNVQSLAARCKDSSEIPDIYMRDEIMSEPASNTDGDGVVEIPVIDMSKLIDPETSEHESQRLHLACQEWGFFQLVNHNVSGDLIKRMKADIIEFFELPMEIKMTYSQLPGSFEGYGHMFVVSKEQKLDWGDMLLLRTHPLGERSMPLWPTQPLTFRDTLSRYSEEVYSLVDSLAVWIAKNLGVNPAVFTKDQTQTVKMNYYPPCPLSEKVLGISPHSDNTFITILLQVNEVQGLEIKKDGRWVSVNPLPGAFVVNIGDSLEIFSNGIYKSIEHRSSVNKEKERLSIPAFFSPSTDSSIGPLPEIVRGSQPNYKTMNNGELTKLFFSLKLYGKSIADYMKLTNENL